METGHSSSALATRPLLVCGDRALGDGVRSLLSADPSLRVLGAPTPSVALHALERDSPSACLVGELFDGGAGLEFIRTLRNQHIWVPAIFIAEERRPDVQAEVQRAGAEACLVRSELSAPLLEATLRQVEGTARALTALRQSEAKFAKAFHASPVPMALGRLEDGVYLDVNRSFEVLTGLSRGETIGKSSLDLGLWRDPADWARLVQQVLAAGSLRDHDLEMFDALGTPHAVRLSAEIIEAEGAKTLLTCIEDVTEQRRAERVERAMRRLARRLLEPVNLRQLGLILAEESRRLFHHDSFILSRYSERERLLLPIYGEDTPRGAASPQECPVEPVRDLALPSAPLLINRPAEPDETPFSRMGDTSRLSRSLMFAAIRWRGETIGQIGVHSYTPGRYSEDDLHVLLVFADHCGAALIRVQAEGAVRESEERYRSLVENLGLGVYRSTADPEGRFLHANHALAAMFGFESVEALLSAPVVSLYEDPAERAGLLAELQRQGRARSREVCMRRCDGQRLWVSVSATVHRGPGGEIQWIDGVVEDITARREEGRARESLQRLAERLSGPLSERALSLAVAAESRLLFEHDAFLLSLYEESEHLLLPVYGEDTAPGAPAPQECPLTPLPNTVLRLEATLLNRDAVPDETAFDRFGQTERLSLSLMFAPIRWQGRTIGQLSVQSYTPHRYSQRDLRLLETFADQCAGALARVRAESALRMSEERHTLVARGAEVGLWDIDLTTGQAYLSPRWKALLGYDPDQELDHREVFTRRVHPDDLPALLEARRRHLERREPFHVELRVRTRQGEYRWFNSTARAQWDAEGRPVRIAGSLTDITARKQAEEALRESEAKFRTLAEAAAAAMFIAQGERAVYANPAAAAITGHSLTEILGMRLWELIHPEDREAARARAPARRAHGRGGPDGQRARAPHQEYPDPPGGRDETAGPGHRAPRRGEDRPVVAPHEARLGTHRAPRPEHARPGARARADARVHRSQRARSGDRRALPPPRRAGGGRPRVRARCGPPAPLGGLQRDARLPAQPRGQRHRGPDRRRCPRRAGLHQHGAGRRGPGGPPAGGRQRPGHRRRDPTAHLRPPLHHEGQPQHRTGPRGGQAGGRPARGHSARGLRPRRGRRFHGRAAAGRPGGRGALTTPGGRASWGRDQPTEVQPCMRKALPC